VGITIYWLFSDAKDPVERNIRDIKTEIRGIRRELQKLPITIASILKHSPEIENAKAITKPKTTKGKKKRQK
jgi:hypothetical protein